jgi:hypothetical protein
MIDRNAVGLALLVHVRASKVRRADALQRMQSATFTSETTTPHASCASARCRSRSSRAFSDRLRHESPGAYLRPLDADAEGADWREVAMIVLSLDVEKDPDRANRVWESHLARAKWDN